MNGINELDKLENCKNDDMIHGKISLSSFLLEYQSALTINSNHNCKNLFVSVIIPTIFNNLFICIIKL